MPVPGQGEVGPDVVNEAFGNSMRCAQAIAVSFMAMDPQPTAFETCMAGLLVGARTAFELGKSREEFVAVVEIAWYIVSMVPRRGVVPSPTVAGEVPPGGDPGPGDEGSGAVNPGGGVSE